MKKISKILLLAMMVLPLVITSCSKDDDPKPEKGTTIPDPNPDPDPNPGVKITISGTVTNYAELPDCDSIWAVVNENIVIGRAAINKSNGQFAVEVPEALPSAYLVNIGGIIAGFSSDITLSDNTAKGAVVTFYLKKDGQNADAVLPSVFPGENTFPDFSTVDFSTIDINDPMSWLPLLPFVSAHLKLGTYIYVDKPTTATGSNATTASLEGLPVTLSTTFNANFGKGWNVLQLATGFGVSRAGIAVNVNFTRVSNAPAWMFITDANAEIFQGLLGL
jgi:hypothetical protein